MRKTITRLIALCSAIASIALAGCGGSGGSAPASTATLSGVAATGAPIVGTVYVKDSSTPARELSAPTGIDGSYSFNVEGMTPPFIVKVTWNGGTQTLMSFATAHGTANITPLSNVIVSNAAGVADPAQLYAGFTPATQQQMVANIATSTTALQTRLKPLFDLYGVTVNPLTGTFVANHTGLDAMLDAVAVTISNGNMVVTNKTTNATICTAPIQNMTAGTFTMSNMPTTSQVPAPATIDGAALYAADCASCHGILASSAKRGATVTQIQTAIASNMGGMGSLSSLSAAEIQAIATALGTSTSTSTTPTPSTTTATAPAAPTGVTANAGANQVTISWGAVTGATSYNIYWSNATGVTKTTGTKIAGAANPYVQTGLAASTAYYYIVTAVNSAGESAASTQAMAMTSATVPTFNALSFYTTDCLGCHGTLGPRTAAQITAAISSFSAMNLYLPTGSNPLTAAQISAIAAVSY